MVPSPIRPLLMVVVLMMASDRILAAQAGPPAGPQPQPEDTEIWEPKPPVVTPGPFVERPPPSDATILFDGTNLDAWVAARGGGPAGWTLEDGVMTVNKATGDIQTRESFGNYQIHLEWRVPAGTTGEGQSRGNSGLFMAVTAPGDSGYELQILDSYENETYVNGMAGSVYKQAIPLANPTRPPGEWNEYDVIWTAPTFTETGELATPAQVTAIFNGVVVQDGYVLTGDTRYIGTPAYAAHGPTPIRLQAHGDPSPPISFRNIWLRRLP